MVYRIPVISIHAPREGGDYYAATPVPKIVISIHAPREGGDVSGVNKQKGAEISIHAPREGGDQLTPFNAKGGY